MQDIAPLTTGVRNFLKETSPMVEALSDFTWSPNDGFLEVVYRSILRRQHDALEAIVDLVDRGRGHAASTLLRPSCEELIWVKYLKTLSVKQAERVIMGLASVQMTESIMKQQTYAGKKVMLELGFTQKMLDDALQMNEKARGKLIVLGQELRWSEHDQKAGSPSLNFLAKHTGSKEMYNFLYHATSRSVHFSISELLRHVWGIPGQVSIRSIHFRDYWSAFSLRWGLVLYLETMIELLETGILDIPESARFDEKRIMEASQLISEFGNVPIITSEELQWPE